MESGHAATTCAPVLSAGLGVQCPGGWALRLASFRLDVSDLGSAALGVVTPRSPASSALVSVLSGRSVPAYGYLRVLGHDLTTAVGRAAIRRQVGVASRTARPVPALTVRHLVDRAARRSCQPGSDRHLLVAAILDRLALTPWSQVPLSAAPALIGRKARLAAACVHQPRLLLIDGLLDDLAPLDRTVLADAVRDAERDAAVIAIGTEAQTLSLVCDRLVTLAGGIMIGSHPAGASHPASFEGLCEVRTASVRLGAR